MATVLPSRLTTQQEFLSAWDGLHNFLIGGELTPFSFEFPPVAELVDVIRRDRRARVIRGRKADRQDLTSIADEFRALPIERAMETEFQLSHFHLSRFYGRGRMLDGFEEGVMVPWREQLRAMGFTCERCKPYVFISGRGCATNYHMDVSHVVAWQVAGTKTFKGLTDPARWAPVDRAVVRSYREELRRPPGLDEADVLGYEMRPGDALWNQFLTPHWVDADDEVAASILISHGGLRLHGRLCQREAALEAWLHEHPEERDTFHLDKFN